jgi:hypothetical protein
MLSGGPAPTTRRPQICITYATHVLIVDELSWPCRHFHVIRGLESAQRFVDCAEDRAEQRQYQQALAEAQQQAARAQVPMHFSVYDVRCSRSNIKSRTSQHSVLQNHVGLQAQRQHRAAEAQRAEAAAVNDTLARRALEQQRAAREVQRLQVHGGCGLLQIQQSYSGPPSPQTFSLMVSEATNQLGGARAGGERGAAGAAVAHRCGGDAAGAAHAAAGAQRCGCGGAAGQHRPGPRTARAACRCAILACQQVYPLPC